MILAYLSRLICHGALIVMLLGVGWVGSVSAQTSSSADTLPSMVSSTVAQESASTTSPILPSPVSQPLPPHGRAVAAIVMRSKDKKVVYEHQADRLHPAASLTKLSNALVFQRLRIPLSKRISLLAKDEVGGGRLRVTSGAKLSARDLLYSTITASANNTATAMARISGVSHARYLALMNEEAKKAGAKHSTFVDFSGMDPRNLTTARDMALIAERAFGVYEIRRAATVGTYRFAVQEGKKTIQKTIKNTNDLLIYDEDVWVTGGKTGYLEESRYNLVVRLRPLDISGTPIRSQELTIVVLGAPTRDESFVIAKNLATQTWKQHGF